MNDIRSFGPACTLGEGPMWHPTRNQLFWFDIPMGTLHCANPLGGQQRSWNFGEPASAAGWLDQDRLLVATASGLQDFTIDIGTWETVCKVEDKNPLTRSNDGRTGPDGSFWFGTMARDMTPHLGKYYRFAKTGLETLIDRISIPNATCFSPDGSTAYLSDTRKQVIWRWPLDGAGRPIGDREVHINLRDENINPDGAVCDAEGHLWNAQWGAWRVARYRPDGTLDRVIELPVSQPTCAAFGGNELKTLYVTSASEGLSEEELAQQKLAGKVFVIETETPGLRETQAVVVQSEAA